VRRGHNVALVVRPQSAWAATVESFCVLCGLTGVYSVRFYEYSSSRRRLCYVNLHNCVPQSYTPYLTSVMHWFRKEICIPEYFRTGRRNNRYLERPRGVVPNDSSSVGDHLFVRK